MCPESLWVLEKLFPLLSYPLLLPMSKSVCVCVGMCVCVRREGLIIEYISVHVIVILALVLALNAILARALALDKSMRRR